VFHAGGNYSGRTIPYEPEEENILKNIYHTLNVLKV
jgi:hypothetical protein